MKFSEINNDKLLWDFMTDPSEILVMSVSQLDGDILVLGGSGKMGKELVGLIRNADLISGHTRNIHVASTFSNQEDVEIFKSMKVDILKGDLADEEFINGLPVVQNVIYMLGYKFGSRSDWRKTFHINSIVPYLIGRKYSKSRILVFSSGNPYPHTPVSEGGCVETDPLKPEGIYGWSIVARESAFTTTALQFPNQKLCFFRLMYAQHLLYGVLVDLARMVWHEEPVSLRMPAVNLISQRDANEIAIRSLSLCNNPPFILNVAGPGIPVKSIGEKLGKLTGKSPQFIGEGSDKALLANDTLCRNTFGSYRDPVDEMIEGAAWWVMNGKRTWNKPTFFGKADHKY
jgi:nucleoside-diphosphate-sugar epimerase